LSTARYYLAGAGTQNAGLAFGGGFPTRACTEEYDGSSWSAGGDLITARFTLGGTGTQNAALAFGGRSPGYVSCTEQYNGSSWSTSVSLITARGSLGGAGTQNSGLAFGGYSPSGVSSCTEEYTSSNQSFVKTFEYSCISGTTCGTFVGDGSGLTGVGANFLSIESNMLPSTDETYDIGSSSKKWNDIYLTDTIQFGNSASISVDFDDDLTVNTNLIVQQTLSATIGDIGDIVISANTINYVGTDCVSPDIEITTNLTVSGCVTTCCLIETSAQRYKENITPMKSQLSKVLRLEPVEFDWKSNKKHDIGFVADSVKYVYPNLVSTNQSGEIEGMNYSKLVSALVKSIQEQQEQIDKLFEEIKILKNK